MKLLLYSFLSLLLVGSSSSYENSESSKINGISLVAPPKEFKSNSILPLANTGANWVALSPFSFMRSLDTSELIHNSKWQWWGERKEGVIKTIEMARQHKLKILLKPQIWIMGGAYTGHISMKTDQQWQRLEKRYEDYLLSMAKVAEANQIEMFSIGTELSKWTVERPDFWSSLIQKVRKVYSGKLTYAANWDTYQNPSFWTQLDCIGVDAYFPLSTSKTPTIEELNIAWLPTKLKLEQFSKRHNKPIVFTEYGYRSTDFTAKEPWDSRKSLGSINHKGQCNALESIRQTFWGEEWFDGGFLWKWFADHPKSGGMQNSQYTVQNKPAEDLLKKLHQTP